MAEGAGGRGRGREGGGVFGGAHVSRRRPGSGGSLCPRPVPFPPPPPSRPSPATPAAPRRPPPPGESRRSRGGGGRAIAVQSLVFLIVENVTGPGGAAAQVPPPPPPPPAPGHRPSTREAGGGGRVHTQGSPGGAAPTLPGRFYRQPPPPRCGRCRAEAQSPWFGEGGLPHHQARAPTIVHRLGRVCPSSSSAQFHRGMAVPPAAPSPLAGSMVPAAGGGQWGMAVILMLWEAMG